jgi:transposase
MARSFSRDLRSRVITAVDGGMSRRAAAKRFEVGIATAIRWLREWRMHGRATALPGGGDLRSHRIEAFAPIILAAIEAEVDITLVGLAELLEREHCARFAPSTIWRLLARHRITLKKTRPRQRAAAAQRGPQAGGLVRRAA